jgi:hypothetical protein
MLSVPRLYDEDISQLDSHSRVEAGFNTSSVALRVVGGDGKGTQCLRYNWANLFLGDKYGGLALHVGGVSNLRQ